MTIDPLIQQLKERLAKDLPFACYSLPDSNELSAIFQTDSQLHDSSKVDDAIFLMAPFELSNPSFCIPRERGELINCEYDLSSLDSEEIHLIDSELEKIQHLDLISKAIKTIEEEACKKIVVSRKKQFLLQSFEIGALLKNLLAFYPDAFRYIWYHPLTGLWCGASPEVLLLSKNNTFQTMALAGTQKIVNDQLKSWSQKEILEQKLVTQVMAQRLQKITSVLRISKRYTHKAGTVAHIRTDLEGIYKKSRFSHHDLAKVLHPTPAVCGTPSESALDFIRENEGYDRMFYTGYVGAIDRIKEVSSLYVNLRCMQLVNNTATLFVGGGITEDSEPNAEWEETQHKLQTMAKVIQPFL